MIVKMRKLHLAALSYDRDPILNALERTHAVEIKEHAETEGTAPLSTDAESLSSYLSALEGTLETLSSYMERAAREDKSLEVVKDGFEVGYSEFIGAKEYREKADLLVKKVSSLLEQKNAAAAEESRLVRAIGAAKPYAKAERPFDAYRPTKNVAVRLGIAASSAWDSLKKQLDGIPLAAYEEKIGENGVLVTAVCHMSAISEFDRVLSSGGFTACPYTGEKSGEQLLASLEKELAAARESAKCAEDTLTELSAEVRPLKIYCDYVDFELEKALSSEKMRSTEHAFFLEAFVPAGEEENVKAALDGIEDPLFYEFSDPAEDEFVPTLAKNNKVVRNFETITNMYSAPNAREFDPNTVMSFFYSVFLGFIMGDIGYGLLMLLGGGFLYYKNRAREGGIKSLAGVFAIGGIFAMLWGLMFNSLFGVQILPFTVMPDAQKGSYTFVGIKIPAMLIISMIIGIIQIFAGYLCKAWQHWRKGRIFDGICDGITWAVFSVGALLAVVGFVEEFSLPILKSVGGITAGAALLAAVLTAGRHERFLGKFTKGFGAMYGIINYMSDVLSYARLYGLMLSGAVIAQIISSYAIDFITGGQIALAVLGVILMAVGHLFNLAMGLLGAYIHDARLQYVEFYGRFYQGEGELFTPLGSKRKHVYVK